MFLAFFPSLIFRAVRMQAIKLFKKEGKKNEK
jgi:hypothetical protein